MGRVGEGWICGGEVGLGGGHDGGGIFLSAVARWREGESGVRCGLSGERGGLGGGWESFFWTGYYSVLLWENVTDLSGVVRTWVWPGA